MKKLLIAIIIVIAFMVLGCQPPEDGVYSVIYHGNGSTSGFPPTDSNEYTTGMEATILGKHTLEKEDHTFLIWNTKADGTGNSYTEDQKITINYSTVFLYAQWKED